HLHRARTLRPRRSDGQAGRRGDARRGLVPLALGRSAPALAFATRRRPGRRRWLIHDRLVHELTEELAILDPDRAGLLGHENAEQLFLRIDPEIRARVATPGVVATRPWDGGNAILTPDREAETEAVARRTEQARRRWRAGVGDQTATVGGHEPAR